MAKDIFVICEQNDGELAKVSLQLLGQATLLAKTTNDNVCAVLLGYGLKNQVQQLARQGADIVYVVDDVNLKYYLTEQYAQAVYYVLKQYEPNIVLFGATSTGRDLAPRLSARLLTGLTADCTGLTVDQQGNLFMTRPAFGGNLFATIVCPSSRPQMSTVRAGVFKQLPPDDKKTAKIVPIKLNWDKSAFKVDFVEEKKQPIQGTPIEDAKILVSCGRGVKDSILKAEDLAKSMGDKAVTSCTRPLIDIGLMPADKQVGQTGKTVRPAVYLALGISGAVQHIAGMEEAEFIIAVNKDKSAPIFKVAHLGIVTDANALIPLLQKQITTKKQQSLSN